MCPAASTRPSPVGRDPRVPPRQRAAIPRRGEFNIRPFPAPTVPPGRRGSGGSAGPRQTTKPPHGAPPKSPYTPSGSVGKSCTPPCNRRQKNFTAHMAPCPSAPPRCRPCGPPGKPAAATGAAPGEAEGAEIGADQIRQAPPLSAARSVRLRGLSTAGVRRRGDGAFDVRRTDSHDPRTYERAARTGRSFVLASFLLTGRDRFLFDASKRKWGRVPAGTPRPRREDFSERRQNGRGGTHGSRPTGTGGGPPW